MLACVLKNVKNSWTGGEALCACEECEQDSLALAIRRHVPGAFERLVETYECSLFRYAERIVQNAHDAQEVIQDTFMRAHRALTEQYSEERCRDLHLKPWIFRIARNLSYNKGRAKMPRAEVSLDVTDDDDLVGLNGSGSEIEKREEIDELNRAIALLPPESRELIVLRFIEEMSYSEISNTTGFNEASLRGKVFRSLKLLREVLGAKGVAHAMS